METVKFTESPSKQGLAFKFTIIICIVILFGLVLYILFGPLPSQSKFLKKSTDGTNNLTVLGDTALNGNLIVGENTQMNGFLNIEGNTRVGDVLTALEIDMITSPSGIDIKQGSVVGSTGGKLSLQGSTEVNVSDLSGTNMVTKFNTGNKQTDFYGDVVLNDPSGSTVLSLKNQSSTLAAYELLNESSGTDNFILRANTNNGVSIKKLMEATGNASTITFSDASIVSPLVYINGNSGLGRVYDTIYNPIPTIGSNPTLVGLTVTGTANFSGIANVSGLFKSRSNVNSLTTTDFYQDNSTAIKGGSLTTDTFDKFFVQGNDSVNISKISSGYYIASFDTSAPENLRSNLTPGLDLKGYMKYTLPTYGDFGSGQVNSYTYITTTNSTIQATTDSRGWPQYPGSGSCNITGWSSSQIGSMALIVGSGSFQGGWVCPKRGIWQVTFNSGVNEVDYDNFSFGIGNVGPSSSPLSLPIPYGLNKVSATVVINQNDIILPNANYCNGGGTHFASTMPAYMIFSLIMELNPETTN